MADPLTRATVEVSAERLQWMVLDRMELPAEFRHFELLREGVLDNATLAEQGFPGATELTLRRYGRITGYLKEYVSPVSAEQFEPGVDIAVATAVHLMESKEAVATWMSEVFLRQFDENVGKVIGEGQTLLAVGRLGMRGFHDEAVGLKALQEGPNGLLSSTVVDFRVGRLLGVSYVVTVGDLERRALVERIGGQFERQIVRVLLGSR